MSCRVGGTGRYFAAAFTNSNRSRVSIVFVARMQPSDAPTAKPPITQEEALFTVQGLRPATMYLVSAYAITGTANNTAVGGPPVVIGSDTSGVVHVPHSYASITPSVLHIKLEQQTDRRVKTDDGTALCPNRSSVMRAATREYMACRKASFATSEVTSALRHTSDE